MTKNLSFLDLPGEIRNELYLKLLVLPAHSKKRPLGDPPIYPAILTTCRKVYEEAKQVLYGCNTFLAHPSLLVDCPRLRLYYDVICSTSLISLMQRYHIRIRLDNDPNFSFEQATKAFTGTEELSIEVFQAQYGSSGYDTLKLFEGIRAIKKVKLYGSTTAFPEYAEWLRQVMMAPRGSKVEPFDKDKAFTHKEGTYDIWIVSINAA